MFRRQASLLVCTTKLRHFFIGLLAPKYKTGLKPTNDKCRRSWVHFLCLYSGHYKTLQDIKTHRDFQNVLQLINHCIPGFFKIYPGQRCVDYPSLYWQLICHKFLQSVELKVWIGIKRESRMLGSSFALFIGL